MRHLITAAVLGRAGQIRQDYQSARPFKHACIEDFLDPAWAETLLQEFPPFDPKKAVDEFGKVGRKAVRTDLREISEHYREFYDYIRSQPFLDAMSEMTGIPGLKFDDRMYGGGTHENLEGQALDAHVDFNYDQDRKLHRRINLLVYLNKEWQVDWGGAIQLHSDPRDWDHDEVKTFNSSFNRCVMFETNEHSWHGFQRIQLPAGKQGLTRKCISIYLYTEERPADEIVPVHGTFYVQRPLPAKYAVGLTLTQQHLDELRQLLGERDEWIAYYQRMEAETSRENRLLESYARILRVYNRDGRLLAKLPFRHLLMRPVRKAAALYLNLHKRLGARRTAPARSGSAPEPLQAMVPGRQLDAADVATLRQLLMERDRRIQQQQAMELTLHGTADALHAEIRQHLRNIPLPLARGLSQEDGSLQGAFAGGWISSDFQVRLRPAGSARRLKIRGWLPDNYPQGMRIEAQIDGHAAGHFTPQPGASFEWDLELSHPSGGPFSLGLKTTTPKPLPVPEGDQRDLAFRLQGIASV